jgi:hypothetical protein
MNYKKDGLPNEGIEIDITGLRKADYDLSKPRMAQGGIVEDSQMNRLFKEGGIADDGMSREPVTGNEIPPGSLASEVRDDIDVKLSEGEYVVPADVLRYYGVRFFEDLRAQAKKSMMEMESNGRIGGASVDEQGVPLESQDEQLTPEEEQMLQEALGTSGMAFGGMVEQPFSTPYQDQAMLYQTPMGMAEGGAVKGFDRTQFTSGDGTAGGIEARKYINPLTKEVRTFNFIGNVALGAIPEGFVPWTQELEDQTQEAPVDNLEETDKKDSRTFRPEDNTVEDSTQGNWGKNNYDALMADPYAFGSTALEDSVKGVAGMLPGIKDITKVNAIAEAKAALAQLDPNSEEAKSLSAKITFATNSISSPVIKGMVKTGLAGTSNAYQAQLDAESEARVTVGAIDAASVAKTYTSPSDEAPSQASPVGNNLNNSTSVTNTVDKGRPSGVTKLTSNNASVANTSTQIAPTASSTPVTSTITNVTSNTANNTNKPLSGTGSIAGTSQGLTNTEDRRAKGGLITKPSKAPKKTRGLAGK